MTLPQVFRGALSPGKRSNESSAFARAEERNIELDTEELEAMAIESKRLIDIDELVLGDEIDELYMNSPYYIAGGEVGQQAFAVIWEATGLHIAFRIEQR
jgi:DNA end-binding protein Ku